MWCHFCGRLAEGDEVGVRIEIGWAREGYAHAGCFWRQGQIDHHARETWGAGRPGEIVYADAPERAHGKRQGADSGGGAL
jgi:hypothetical protein